MRSIKTICENSKRIQDLTDDGFCHYGKSHDLCMVPEGFFPDLWTVRDATELLGEDFAAKWVMDVLDFKALHSELCPES